MYKKNLVYFLLILLLVTSCYIYDRYMSNSTVLSNSVEISKWDFIDFPMKENQAKIYPLIKELNTNIIKPSTEQSVIVNPPEIKKPVLKETVLTPTAHTLFKLGDDGDEIKYIQYRLNEYGYKIVEDGLFRAITHDAILNFQYRCGLDIDGRVGFKTLEELNIPPHKNVEFNTKVVSLLNSKNTTSNIALKNYKSVSALEASINSLKVTSQTNYHIDVDISNQRVNIFTLSNGRWVLDNSFICSSGKPSTPTIKGNFTIKDKGPMFRAGPNTICNYYTQFYGNYLFHTVLLDNNENIQDGRLGTALSHGCIRLAIDDAKYIYTTIPYGTSVSIQ